MRVAVLIVGLLLGLVMFLQAFVGTILADATNNENVAGAAAVGVLVALLWLVGCAVVIAFPSASVSCFAVAGVLALLVSGDFPDMAIWGVISFVLAVMSFFGHRGKKAQDAKRAERERLVQEGARAQLLLAQHFAGGTPKPCPECGAANALTARYCANCGALAN